MTGNRISTGAKLKALRNERKIKQADAAEAIGIERASLSMIENDRDKPGRETLFALAEYYGVTVDYLKPGSPAVSQPEALDFVYDTDELAWIDLWRGWDRSERALALKMLGAKTGVRKAG